MLKKNLNVNTFLSISSAVVTLPFFCSNASIVVVDLIIYFAQTFYKWSIIHQSYSRLTEIDALEQKNMQFQCCSLDLFLFSRKLNSLSPFVIYGRIKTCRIKIKL